MFEGLYLAEIILMVCGVILFGVLMRALVKGKSSIALVPLFLISIAMIGWSGIQKVEFENGKLAIIKLSEELSENPDSKEIRTELEVAVAEVGRRVGLAGKAEADALDPNTLLILAKGNLVLERYEDAFDLASVAATKEPESRDAENLVKRAGIGVLKKAMPPASLPSIEREPVHRLREVTSFLETRTDLSAEDHVELSRAYNALGDGEKAMESLIDARTLEPDVSIPVSLRVLEVSRPPSR